MLVEVFGGSWGGRPDRDGIDGISHPALNQRNIPAEHIEMEHPVELVRYGFVPDTGGAGKFRGGLSLVRDIRYLGKVPAQLQVRSDRCDHMPWGLAGGSDGTPSYNLLNPGTEAERRLRAMDTTTIREGEIVRFVCPGAGGWGDPLERDPSAAAADIREGRLSTAYVHEHYALAFSEDGELDEAETRAASRPTLVAVSRQVARRVRALDGYRKADASQGRLVATCRFDLVLRSRVCDSRRGRLRPARLGLNVSF